RVSEFQPNEDRAGAYAISAERGYGRELANLIFHISLVAVLITVAFGRLVYYEGQVIVVTDTGSTDLERSNEVCNTSLSNYDSFRVVALFDGTRLHEFCFQARDLVADYLPNGQAVMFIPNISFA